MNNCNFIGRLTKDPELKATKSGKSVTSFCIAVNRRVKSGEQAQADYIDCVAWDKTAEIICKYFSKGSPIGLNGRLQTRTYEKDGEKRKVTELMVNEFDFVGSKSSESKAETETAATQEVIDDTTATVEDTFTPSLPFEV
jgi:single-strand DNA-binding protein